MVACARHCCICHQFCGTKIELHHIQRKIDGGTDKFENCIPLCLSCHADQSSYDFNHPKGTKYTLAELQSHRHRWYNKVESTPSHFYNQHSRAFDVQTYSLIKSALPWDGIIAFLKLHHFESPFERKLLKPIYEYRCLEINPEFEFLDAELEALRAALHQSINNFRNRIGQRIGVSDRDPDILELPREWKTHDPLRYSKEASLINEAASIVGQCYDSLMKSCRRKLGPIS